MNRRLVMAAVIALIGLTLACRRAPALDGKLRTAGGASVLQSECAEFIRLSEQSDGRHVWMARNTSFPPVIAALKPQAISATSQDGVAMVDLQVTGGFAHHGLLIAPRPPVDFQPRRGNWDVWQIAPGVWEYRE